MSEQIPQPESKNNPESRDFHSVHKERKKLREKFRDVAGMSWNKAKKLESVPAEGNIETLIRAIKNGEAGQIKGIEIDDNHTLLASRLNELDRTSSEFSSENVSEVREARRIELSFEKISLELNQLSEFEEELTRREYEISRESHGGMSSVDKKSYEQIFSLKSTIKERKLAIISNPETAQAYRMWELRKYQKELAEGFAVTPSRKEMMDWVQARWERNQRVLLEGHTGTGKTELLRVLHKILYGENPEVLRSSERVGPSEIMGKILLRPSKGADVEKAKKIFEEAEQLRDEWRTENPDASKKEENLVFKTFIDILSRQSDIVTETYFQEGVYTRAIDRGVALLIDEMNRLSHDARLSLKELYNRKPGDPVTIQEDSGREHIIQEGFAIGATANLKSEKHKERFELDNAESRVFKMKELDYMPAGELFDLCRAQLMDAEGSAPISKEEAVSKGRGSLVDFVDAALETQRAYKNKLGKHYGVTSSKGGRPSLEKAVLDPGAALGMLSEFGKESIKGRSLTEVLDEEIFDFVTKGDYPEKDRDLLIRIFASFGFLKDLSADKFGIKDLKQEMLDSLRPEDVSVEKEKRRKSHNLSLQELANLDPYGVSRQRHLDLGMEFDMTNAYFDGEGNRVEFMVESYTVGDKTLEPGKIIKKRGGAYEKYIGIRADTGEPLFVAP